MLACPGASRGQEGRPAEPQSCLSTPSFLSAPSWQADVLKRCVGAEPRYGERWQRVAKALANAHQKAEVGTSVRLHLQLLGCLLLLASLMSLLLLMSLLMLPCPVLRNAHRCC